jgi:hypothetical protein
MSQHSVQVPEITARFGVSTGSPQKITNSGLTVIYTPSPGKKIRLKWLALATPESNSGAVIATITLDGIDIYMWPLGVPGAFMHSSVREGGKNGVLTITLSDAQEVYVNLDVEEFENY